MNDAPAARPPNRLAYVAFAVAALGGLLVLLAGPGTRAGGWDFRTGFTLLRYGAWAALAGAVLAVFALLLWRRSRAGNPLALLALLVALPAVLVPWQFRRVAMAAPPIHDITTDTENPPLFSRLLEERERVQAPNSAAYEGDSVARLQREAYPDIGPVMLAVPPDSAFALAFQAARAMGWEIAEAEASEGRIEATATTRWFGFKDDVVIRVRPASGISRLDVRSVSRVGRGDAGANAARIRRFLEKLPDRVEAL